MCLAGPFRRGATLLSNSVRDLCTAPGLRTPRVAVVLDNGSAEVWNWESGALVCRAALAKGARCAMPG
jgi:hypothetical protein